MEIVEVGGRNNRIATEKGKRIGIVSLEKKSDEGRTFYKNYYNEEAQKFVFEYVVEELM